MTESRRHVGAGAGAQDTGSGGHPILPPKVLRNAARCRSCGEELESRHRHDFVSCSCGSVSVDGGFDYVRRAWKAPNGEQPDDIFDELSEYESETDGPH